MCDVRFIIYEKKYVDVALLFDFFIILSKLKNYLNLSMLLCHKLLIVNDFIFIIEINT